MEDEYVTVAEAAALKGVSRMTIYKAIAQGQLRTQHTLGKTALRRREVVAWQPSSKVGQRKGTPMSEEAKAHISQGQKKRWAERKRGASP